MANKTDLGIKLTGDSKSLQDAIKQVESSLKNLQSLSSKFKDSFNLSGNISGLDKLGSKLQKALSDIKIDKNLSEKINESLNIKPNIKLDNESIRKSEIMYASMFDKIYKMSDDAQKKIEKSESTSINKRFSEFESDLQKRRSFMDKFKKSLEQISNKKTFSQEIDEMFNIKPKIKIDNQALKKIELSYASLFTRIFISVKNPFP